jgi:hypothetical protein
MDTFPKQIINKFSNHKTSLEEDLPQDEIWVLVDQRRLFLL